MLYYLYYYFCFLSFRVVSGSRDATLRVWNIDSGQCLHVLMGHVAAVRCVQYDGHKVNIDPNICFEIKETKITRGHNSTLVKKQSRLDVRKFSFSQRTTNVWNKLSAEE